MKIQIRRINYIEVTKESISGSFQFNVGFDGVVGLGGTNIFFQNNLVFVWVNKNITETKINIDEGSMLMCQLINVISNGYFRFYK